MDFKVNGITRKQKVKRCDKIFIAGIESGVGATHFSILLANFRAGLLREKVALVDFNKDNDYMCLGETVGKNIGNTYFVRDKVCYYPGANSDILQEVFLEDYECIIIDAGDSYSKYKVEAGLCDLRYLIISSTIWKTAVLKTEYEKNFSKCKKQEWKLLYSFGASVLAKELEVNLGRKLSRIPFIETPFKVNREVLEELKKIIGEV